MATFAKPGFAAASYAAFRPSYPPSLYNAILAHHRGPKSLVVDLGAGTGIATRDIGTHFDQALGVEPSAGMIKQAQEKSPPSKFRFAQGSAESLPFVQDGSVDCVTAAQAAHWFDYPRLWPEMRRVVRRGGTLAFWGYKDHVFVDFPVASAIMQSYAYDQHPDKRGSYWRAGREIVQNKLRAVQPPAEDWTDVTRIEYEPGLQGRHSGEGTMFMEKTVSIAECKDYVRTWSAYHGWKEAHPAQEARSKGGEGDVMDRMFDEIAAETAHFRNESNSINIEWGSALILATRR